MTENTTARYADGREQMKFRTNTSTCPTALRISFQVEIREHGRNKQTTVNGEESSRLFGQLDMELKRFGIVDKRERRQEVERAHFRVPV